MIVTPTPGCLVCHKPIESIKGKRQRKYCSDSCRQKAYQSANKVEMVSISKVEYDRLLAAASSWNNIKTLEKQGKTVAILVPEGVEIHYEPLPETTVDKIKPYLSLENQVEVNTKQKKIKGDGEGKKVVKAEFNIRSVTPNIEIVNLAAKVH